MIFPPRPTRVWSYSLPALAHSAEPDPGRVESPRLVGSSTEEQGVG